MPESEPMVILITGVMAAGKSTVAARLAAGRGGRRPRSGAAQDRLRRLDRGRLQGELARTPRIGLWPDNSDSTPDETVDEILASLSR
jgi:signal recognition particle GTPase